MGYNLYIYNKLFVSFYLEYRNCDRVKGKLPQITVLVYDNNWKCYIFVKRVEIEI